MRQANAVGETNGKSSRRISESGKIGKMPRHREGLMPDDLMPNSLRQ
jgi:hypothetical protein